MRGNVRSQSMGFAKSSVEVCRHRLPHANVATMSAGDIPNRTGCPEFRRLLAIERRSFLKVGVLGFAGLTLGELLKFEALAADSKRSRQTSVIILWMRGGPSQHETWDPKPDAPDNVRGEYKAISTALPGVQFTDIVPRMAQELKRYAVLRSWNPRNGSHGTADTYWNHCAFRQGPDGLERAVGVSHGGCESRRDRANRRAS